MPKMEKATVTSVWSAQPSHTGQNIQPGQTKHFRIITKFVGISLNMRPCEETNEK